MNDVTNPEASFSALLASRAVLRVAGPDYIAFLQGLITNDMQALKNAPAFAALLSPQGKVLFDLILHPIEGGVLMDCEAARLPELQARLGQFKLRAKVDIEPTHLKVQASWGAAGNDPRLAALGDRTFGEDFAATHQEDAYRAHRYMYGVPENGEEIGGGNATASEVNFDLLNGVSFTKGCYMGQELTARMHYRALVKKRLLPFTFENALKKGDVVSHNGAELGTVSAVQNSHGIGVFNLERSLPLVGQDTDGVELLRPSYLPAQ